MKIMSLAVLCLALSAAAGPSWSTGVAGKAGAPGFYGRVFPPITLEQARSVSKQLRGMNVDLSKMTFDAPRAFRIDRLAMLDPDMPRTQRAFSALLLAQAAQDSGDLAAAVSNAVHFLHGLAKSLAPDGDLAADQQDAREPEAWERYAAALEEIDDALHLISGRNDFTYARGEALTKAKLLRALRRENLIKGAEASAAALDGGAASKETQAPQEEPGALEAYYAALLDPSVDPKSASAVIEAIADHNRRAGRKERKEILRALDGMQYDARSRLDRSPKRVLAALSATARGTPSGPQKLEAIRAILGAQSSYLLDGDRSMDQDRLDAVIDILNRSDDKRLHAAGIRLLKAWRPELGKGRKAYNDAIDQVVRRSQTLPGGPRKDVRRVNRFADFFAGAAARAKEEAKDHQGELVVGLLALAAFLAGGLISSAHILTMILVSLGAAAILVIALNGLARKLGIPGL